MRQNALTVLALTVFTFFFAAETNVARAYFDDYSPLPLETFRVSSELTLDKKFGANTSFTIDYGLGESFSIGFINNDAFNAVSLKSYLTSSYGVNTVVFSGYFLFAGHIFDSSGAFSPKYGGFSLVPAFSISYTHVRENLFFNVRGMGALISTGKSYILRNVYDIFLSLGFFATDNTRVVATYEAPITVVSTSFSEHFSDKKLNFISEKLSLDLIMGESDLDPITYSVGVFGVLNGDRKSFQDFGVSFGGTASFFAY